MVEQQLALGDDRLNHLLLVTYEAPAQRRGSRLSRHGVHVEENEEVRSEVDGGFPTNVAGRGDR